MTQTAATEPVTLASLALLPRWVGWKTAERNGKPTKVPFNPRTDREAKADDPATWAPREAAEDYAARVARAAGGGVGIELGDLGDGRTLAGIDLDTCRDPETQSLEPWAAEVVERFRSYTEVSPSGGGAKVFFTFATADLPQLRALMGDAKHSKMFKRRIGEQHPPGIEVHLGNRYFTVTEQLLPGSLPEIRHVETATIAQLLEHEGPAFAGGGKAPKKASRPRLEVVAGKEASPSAAADGAGADDALMGRLQWKMALRPRLSDRWHGAIDGLKDTSRSGLDMSMMALLRRAGFTYEECRALLIRWPAGAGAEKAVEDRYFRRMWDATGRPGAGDAERAEGGIAGEWAAGLIKGERGTLAACEANIALILRNHEAWQDVLWLDEFAQQLMFRLPPPWVPEDERDGWKPRPVKDADLSEITIWMQAEAGMMASVQKVLNAVSAVCASNRFHPVRDYLDGLRWDGTPRIGGWLPDYIGAAANPYHEAVGARWLIGAVARIYRPGCKLDTALILEGPQGLKKSTAAKVLGGEWFTDSMPDLGSKDAMQQLQGAWIVELAELSAMGRTETSRVKAFMSTFTDRFRPSYGRLAQDFPRQCAFIGSVNPEGGYLKDATGARRFWVVQCGARIDIEALRRDRDQLWAEAVHQFKAGAVWWLDTAELERAAAEQQAERYAGDARDAIILEWVARKPSVSIVEVLEGALGIVDRGRQDQAAQNMVARCLTAAGWKRRRLSGDGRPWRYFAPEMETVAHVPVWATGTRLGQPEAQEHQGHVPVSQLSQSNPRPMGQAGEERAEAPRHSGTVVTAANAFGSHAGHRDNRDTGTSTIQTPGCKASGCPGAWVKDEQNQLVCRCAVPGCLAASFFEDVSQSESVSQYGGAA